MDQGRAGGGAGGGAGGEGTESAEVGANRRGGGLGEGNGRAMSKRISLDNSRGEEVGSRGEADNEGVDLLSVSVSFDQSAVTFAPDTPDRDSLPANSPAKTLDHEEFLLTANKD